MGLHSPRILAANIDNGYLLLSDLGSDQYLGVLEREPERAPQLYTDAIAALRTMQQKGSAFQSLLPPYSEKLLRFELSLFHHWLCATHLQLIFSDREQVAWQECCDFLVRKALQQPQVFVHRDYHSRNLMVVTENNPGILDFQDAVEGPLTYDLVSLLKDCYVDWTKNEVRQWVLQFYKTLGTAVRARVDERQFRRYFDLMGVQRHLKAAGIFCRLMRRDGKPDYLAHVPRTLNYIVELADDYEELHFLTDLIRDRILPDWSVSS
jgi:aminoglycoside/choline kinase family phosphotransferase